ncbi:adenylate/guanylate cyclase domain-containing protein [uncultured Croceitalea sp.]|uniref:adenylate/guanylate cyclase domain-containing protein n=1 Tax=uncultured Croceitalea sp. TaxID=1798908 RepID=UPI00330595D2
MTQRRQLSAIMFTDIEGYTAHMQHDEESALRLRDKHREIFESATEKFEGKIIQYFGDGTLSVYGSTVEAVRSAIEMQLAFIKENIPVRIGIHVGDIAYSKEDIIGDAVNIASRIESCAVSGSILVSDKVHDQIRSHRDIHAKFLDAYDLKNVDDALPLFAIANEGLVIPDAIKIKGKLKEGVELDTKSVTKKKALSLVLITIVLCIGALLIYQFLTKQTTIPNSELSIAVLPFDNLSIDDDAEIFRDGMTEDILTQLSKLKELHVISRTSVMQYKKTKKTIPEIAKELGVTYILEGSIQKYGDKVRVTAQLINAEGDKHIWAENYDRTLDDIFGIQTEVSNEIVGALKLNLSFEEKQNLASIPTKNLKAYQYFLRGRQEADKRTNESIEKSIELYQRALEEDPNYAEAYAEIANSTFLQTYYGAANPSEASIKTKEYLLKAEELDNRISRVYTVKGLLYNHTKKFNQAKAAFEKAILLSPNDVTARHQYATFFYYTNQYEKQLEQTKIAYKLDPFSFATASSYFSALTYTKRYEEAEKLLEQIEEKYTEYDRFSINRLYMRLYMAKPDYEKAIEPLTELANNDKAYYRFLGYSYAQLGDTLNAYKIIDSIKAIPPHRMKNHRIAVVFAGLRQTDSTLFYLDTLRNKSKLFDNPRLAYFDYLKTDAKYSRLLKAHGITSE